MAAFFNTILHQPLFNALIFLQQTISFGDLGVAIILLTLIVRLILYPLSYKGFKSQMIMQRIQPEIKSIQEKHKDNKEKQAELLMEVWKKNKVNPFSGFVLLIIQLPILLALYRIFLSDFSTESLKTLYAFVPHPEIISKTFLGLIDLSEKSIVIVGIAAVLQYIHGKLSLARPQGSQKGQMNKMTRNMVFLGPIITIVFLTNLPSAVGIYWATTSAFSIFQQIIIGKSLHSSNDGTDQPKTNNRETPDPNRA
jgi:YidC/Oxa1 family membrane protein insertase